MNNAYEPDRAEKLVPLLRSIGREIRERGAAIRLLEAELAGERTGDDPAVEARLATERRGLRLALRELARLGCVLDELHPFRILIPGKDGELLTGYQWEPGDERVRPAAANTLS
jgi:hypothetical protein